MHRMESRKGREDPVHLWALSRLGARVPLYGPLNAVVPREQGRRNGSRRCSRGTGRSPRRSRSRSRSSAAAPAIARAISTTRPAPSSRAAVRAMPGGDRAVVLVEQVVALEAREERVALGDTLPAGLKLVLDDEADEASP